MNKSIKKIMNAVVTTGEYIDRQGIRKKSYLTIGKLFFYKNGGISLKLDALPINNQTIQFYDDKPKRDNPPPRVQGYNSHSQ